MQKYARSKSGLAAAILMVAGLLMALVLPGRLAAQIDRGEVTGTVEDPSGAAVANAQLTLTNNATGVSVATKSTATGTYVLDDLMPGQYTIQAEAPGFQRYVVHGVSVHVQQVLT